MSLSCVRSGWPNESLIGTTVAGRYQIESVVGRGGMSVVYRALDTVGRRRCALKVLPPETGGTDRLMNEVRAGLAVENPHVVDVIDFGRFDDGSSYLALEYTPGKMLSQVLRAEGFVDVERALYIGKQVAKGMVAAHDADVIHRDLKPDNILLTQRGNDPDFVRLLDFGIAKVRDYERDRAGSILGTPGYMSPEQAEGRDVDGRTDVYSLGVVLYEMISGCAPFTSRTAIGLLTQHICFEPRSMRTLPDAAQTIPAQLDAIVLKCLAKRAVDRYPSMRELLRALEELERERILPPRSTIVRYVSKIPLLRRLAAS